MTPAEFNYALLQLRLEPKEAARLLSVEPKTVQRWTMGLVTVPGPVKEALKAWLQLDRMHFPWRPDGMPTQYMDEEEIGEQIRLLREEAIDLAALLKRVDDRGGPSSRWQVNIEQGSAELTNIMRIHFYPLPNGGFTLSSYSRIDDQPADLRRDGYLIDDAITCIADAISLKQSKIKSPPVQRRLPKHR